MLFTKKYKGKVNGGRSDRPLSILSYEGHHQNPSRIVKTKLDLSVHGTLTKLPSPHHPYMHWRIQFH